MKTFFLDKFVIIIEDEPIIALDFERTILNMGVSSVKKFFKGEKALSAIKNKKPDVVLLDINLNNSISGYTLSEELKALNIPFIIITGSSDPQSLHKINKMRADSVLIKPVYETEIKEALTSALNFNKPGFVLAL